MTNKFWLTFYKGKGIYRQTPSVYEVVLLHVVDKFGEREPHHTLRTLFSLYICLNGILKVGLNMRDKFFNISEERATHFTSLGHRLSGAVLWFRLICMLSPTKLIYSRLQVSKILGAQDRLCLYRLCRFLIFEVTRHQQFTFRSLLIFYFFDYLCALMITLESVSHACVLHASWTRYLIDCA